MHFPPKHPLRTAIQIIASSALLASATGPIHAQTAVDTGSTSVRPGEPVTLNFANAEIEAVARTMATITGRNVVVDPRVKGTLNLVTERAVSPAAAFQQFLAALRLQGFTVVESAGLYKVVPEADAKLQSGSVSVARAGSSGPAGGQIVTQIFKLNYESASNLVPVLRPLISPNNTINVNPGTNALVITDYADNLQRLGKIIAAMDVSNASDVEIIPLKNALATDLAPLVARLIDSGAAPGAAGGATPGQADTSFKTTLLAEPRSNALVLRAANPARVAQVRALVEKLDQAPVPGSSAAHGNIHVVYLKNADATQLATTLRAAMSAGSGNAASAGSGPGPQSPGLSPPPSSTGSSNAGLSTGMGASLGSSASSNQPSTGGQIQADPSTNSLIITAPEPQYRQLRAVIDQLDGRRAQVLVESLIAEVNMDKAAQFGVQWQSLLGQGNNVVGVAGSNFTVGGINLFSLAAGLSGGVTATSPVPSPGFNFGVAAKHNGKFVLGALANLLQTSGDGNVLSTPNLLTLDNEEAKILIGENVPFVTGSYSTTGNTSTVNPFTTVERKDVGLTLRVKPQINENGTVKLVIYQETSAVKAGTENSANGPSTTKRSIESTVLVEDGAIVVLGGLLQDQYTGSQQKVPYLGDIPGVGALFRSDTRARTKTNLMVFLRPVVVRDANESSQLSLDRYDIMRGVQQAAQPVPSGTVPVNEAPLLPALAGRPGAAPAAAVPAPLGNVPTAPVSEPLPSPQ
ncbi:type II secretion system protein GspD [Acidovorax sp. SRB_14]|uniref:type II secretion system secretin GspD n=1 Tax=unclassified Acidovorax TaxID=2684926 RepID=UPI00145F1D42|nr:MULTISPECIES: type II secretion system secretin GspD [unclassified Acidovorax]NMM77286.1 type II secretion system protein GspD [Acidovorax sp. SRB_24]NMM80168.1 type II secretion system protein GspD [Acidovorax sp. SRB_14]NMM89837.1 type II secretion system protein GspD [Rhodococcus sp. SRB_17]